MEENKTPDRMPFWDGHRERLRQRLETGGLDALRPHEVLELLLGVMMPRADMSGVSRALIDRFGRVRDVLRAERRQLEGVEGMSRRLADWLLLAGETVAAYRNIDTRRQFRIWRFADMLKYLVPLWRAVPPPQTWVIFTGRDSCVLGTFVLGDSLYIGAEEYAREILENALMLEARFAFLIGFFGIEPLELYDEEYGYLQALADMLSSIDVQLMDFVLVGEAGFVSLNMEGKFDAIRQTELEKRLRERYLSEPDEEGKDENAGNRPFHEGEPEPL